MKFMKQHFQILANYNLWANQRLYQACRMLSTDEYKQDRKAFFKSIHGTLNHLLVVDRLWLGRCKTIDSGITALDQTLYPDLDSLAEARQVEDENIIHYIDNLDGNILSEKLYFKTLAGKESSMELNLLISHFFNHQTHHRGQVHNMLSQTNAAPPSIDLYMFCQSV